MKRELCIVIIAHNQCKLVQQQLKNYEAFVKKKGVHIFIVDNASETGLREWLKGQKGYKYLCYENEMEDYSVILNTVSHKYAKKMDIFLVGAHMLLLPDCVERIQNALYEKEKIGAVCASPIPFGSKEGKNVMTAIQYTRTVKPKKGRASYLNKDAVCFRYDFMKEAGDFAEYILRPDEVIQDYRVRGEELGYQFYTAEDACLFQLVEPGDMYQEKYGMGY